MPLTAKGEEIYGNLLKEYGSEKKAKEVLYAGKNKGTFTEIDAALDALSQKLDGLASRLDAEETRCGMDALSQAIDAFKASRSDESERAKENAHGKLSEHEREEIGRVGSKKREGETESEAGFLLPGEKKYPVKVNGKYDRKLLLAAAREARMHGHEDLAKKADRIREREFGGS